MRMSQGKEEICPVHVAACLRDRRHSYDTSGLEGCPRITGRPARDRQPQLLGQIIRPLGFDLETPVSPDVTSSRRQRGR